MKVICFRTEGDCYRP